MSSARRRRDRREGESPVISVWGSSRSPVDSDEYQLARRLGALLAGAGVDVACGGYAGVMEGVSRGVSEAGGRAIGYTVEGWSGGSGRSANAYLTEERPCPDLYERLRRLVEDSNGFVALGGGIGTLAEVVVAWNHLHLKLIDRRPLLVVGPHWARMLGELRRFPDIDERHLDLIQTCADLDAVMTELAAAGVVS